MLKGKPAKEKWSQFRLEMIERDGGKCARCDRGLDDGAVLQIHHTKYIVGRRPWEYDYNDCETLCKGCHASEHGIIAPKTGWHNTGYDDLGDLSGTCELCGAALRHAFYIDHPSWEPMTVGTYCCDSLTGTELASNKIESIVRFETRKKRFISSTRWTETLGRPCIKQKNIDIQILRAEGGFKIQMNGHCGKKVFETAEGAKEATFEVIESGEAENFLKKHNSL